MDFLCIYFIIPLFISTFGSDYDLYSGDYRKYLEHHRRRDNNFKNDYHTDLPAQPTTPNVIERYHRRDNDVKITYNYETEAPVPLFTQKINDYYLRRDNNVKNYYQTEMPAQLTTQKINEHHLRQDNNVKIDYNYQTETPALLTTQKSNTESVIGNVNVTVYYETLCPASIDFFENQLGPVTEKFGKYLNIHIVPYGHAQTLISGDKYSFRCQHGFEECYGNKLHACSIDVLNNSTLSTMFNACLMKTHRRLRFKASTETCSQLYNVSDKVNPILECLHGERGRELLKIFGVETKTLRPKYVPYILVNDSNSIQRQARVNFEAVICSELQWPTEIC